MRQTSTPPLIRKDSQQQFQTPLRQVKVANINGSDTGDSDPYAITQSAMHIRVRAPPKSLFSEDMGSSDITSGQYTSSRSWEESQADQLAESWMYTRTMGSPRTWTNSQEGEDAGTIASPPEQLLLPARCETGGRQSNSNTGGEEDIDPDL